MKKLHFILGATIVLMASSCTIHTSTSTSVSIPTRISSRNTADLVVGQKASTKYIPTRQERKMGINTVKQNAVADLLEKNNNADVLVAPQYTVEKKKYLFRSKILSVKVSGYPAFYKNIKPVNSQNDMDARTQTTRK